MNKLTRQLLSERAAKVIFAACAAFSMAALAVITVFLFSRGLPFMTRYGVGDFLFGMKWNPQGDNPTYGVFPMIVTTLYLTALSVIIGVGVGLLAAVCLFKFLPRRLVSPIRRLINLLAGIPSVIYGLFGLTIIVPFVRRYISPDGVGYGIFSASIVLAIMILPTVVSMSYDALVAVPTTYYEGALALGATPEESVFRIVLPAAKSGVAAGAVLATGRALGETMAVIMVLGNSPELPTGLFQSVRSLTANIAMGAMELSDDALLALIASGVVLFVFALALNISFSCLRAGGEKKVKK